MPAAARAVELAVAGKVSVLVKGSLHTDELLEAVVAPDSGLRTERRMSHIYVMDVPAYPKPLIVTDAAINIRPTLDHKRDICQNAIDLLHRLGIKEPLVAVLAAVETVNSKMPSTLDAAALTAMAARGQITGGKVDGPLAFDNAISMDAARTKGIVSPVAGQADILLVPDLEAGNMLAKQLIYFGGAIAAGLVLGARVPIVLTSRSDSLTRAYCIRGAGQAGCVVSTREESVVMTADLLLTFNAGSSSIKIGVFEIDRFSTRRLATGLIDFRKAPLRFHVTEGPAIFDVDLKTEASEDLSEVLSETFGWLAKHFNIQRMTAVGHRVVHGGDTFSGPVRIADSTIKAIDALTMLAPLHQPQCLRLIRAIQRLRRMSCRSRPSIRHFIAPIPRSFGVSPSRASCMMRASNATVSTVSLTSISPANWPAAFRRRQKAKVVIAHLGSGASLCGLKAGVSQDSSMGFSTLDGIPMATRCGALDPGVLLHLLGQLGRPIAEIENILYKKSGLLGVSGISADSRELLASKPSGSARSDRPLYFPYRRRNGTPCSGRWVAWTPSSLRPASASISR